MRIVFCTESVNMLIGFWSNYIKSPDIFVRTLYNTLSIH